MSKLRGKIKHASRQSDLIRWLQNNRAWFAKEISEAGVPNWDAITKMICDEGILDAKQNPPNKETVRKAWSRVSITQPKPKIIHHEETKIIQEPIQETKKPNENIPDYLAMSQLIKEKRRIK